MEEVKKYHKNGKLSSIGLYEDGEREGEWKFYHENGELWEIVNFKDGKEEGEWKLFRRDESLAWIGSHKNGKQDGQWKFFDTNGKLIEIRHYKNNKILKRNIMEKRKPGRPKGTTKPDSRKAYLTIRLTDNEKLLIKEEAEKLGVPIIDVFMMFMKFYKEHQK